MWISHVLAAEILIIRWWTLVFLSSGGHGATQLPNEKFLRYSCETSNWESSEIRSSYHLWKVSSRFFVFFFSFFFYFVLLFWMFLVAVAGAGGGGGAGSGAGAGGVAGGAAAGGDRGGSGGDSVSVALPEPGVLLLNVAVAAVVAVVCCCCCCCCCCGGGGCWWWWLLLVVVVVVVVVVAGGVCWWWWLLLLWWWWLEVGGWWLVVGGGWSVVGGWWLWLWMWLWLWLLLLLLLLILVRWVLLFLGLVGLVVIAVDAGFCLGHRLFWPLRSLLKCFFVFGTSPNPVGDFPVKCLQKAQKTTTLLKHRGPVRLKTSSIRTRSYITRPGK